MIRAVLIDDEEPALEEMEFLLKEYPIEVAAKIQDARGSLAQIERLKPDAVFLDIDMPGANGLELALQIQELYGGIAIIFVTAYSEYALDAFKAYPLDYILKPVNEKRLAKTMQHLLRSDSLDAAPTSAEYRTHIRCFGEFEVCTENGEKRVMKFSTRQAKEMFAYLIGRFEKTVPRGELVDIVFGGEEDRKTVNLLHVTVYKLRHALEELGIDREIITLGGNYTLKAADGVCDYIDFIKFTEGNPYIDKDNCEQAEAAVKLYGGTFLENEDYLWAEEIRADTERRFESLMLGIAAYYRRSGKTGKCEKTLITLLRHDSLSDQANRAILDLYMETRELTKFREHFEEYRITLKEELQMEPDQVYADFNEKCKKIF